MRRSVWLVPLLAGLLLAGCSSAAPPRAGDSSPGSGTKQPLVANGAAKDLKKDTAAVQSALGEAAGADDLLTGSVPMDPVRLRDVQAAADAGRRPESLDPVRTVTAAAADLGLNLKQDQVKLDYTVSQGAGSGTGEAYVDVLHAGREYVVQLIQPVRSGPGGIWAVNSVRDVGSARDNAAKLDVVRQYFAALAGQDYDTAYGLLARRFRQSTSAASLAGNDIAQVVSVERATWNSPSADVLVVDINLRLSGSRSAWGDGINTRFVSFESEDGAWKIAGLASSP